jgi:hypothetical protein
MNEDKRKEVKFLSDLASLLYKHNVNFEVIFSPSGCDFEFDVQNHSYSNPMMDTTKSFEIIDAMYIRKLISREYS